MVYVAPNEAAAILPSMTPIGTGTIKVTSNGVTATAPIKVVAAAFGIFTVRAGFPGPAVAFKVSADDGSTTQIIGDQSVRRHALKGRGLDDPVPQLHRAQPRGRENVGDGGVHVPGSCCEVSTPGGCGVVASMRWASSPPG